MILDEPFGNNAYEKIVNFLGGPTLSMGAKLATEGQKAYTARTPEDRLEAGKRAANAVTPYYKMGESAYNLAIGDKTIDAAGKDVDLSRFEMTMRAMTAKQQVAQFEIEDLLYTGRRIVEAVPIPIARQTSCLSDEQMNRLTEFIAMDDDCLTPDLLAEIENLIEPPAPSVPERMLFWRHY
jgi:hypothetical protein